MSKIITYILKLYILYALVCSVIIFGFGKHNNSEYLDTHSIERFFGESISQDRVALVEERYYSGLARVNLIKSAEETLDISYYTMHDGVSTNIFLGCILDAADRGVQVRFLLDGVFHNLKGNLKNIIYTFADHPNIELKFYEPFSMLRPWTWNNRLHDKYIIVDDKLAMIGGRNIGDKYFAGEDYDGSVVNDRDVVIVNMTNRNFSDSAIYQIKDYFDHIWNHEFSKYLAKKLDLFQQSKGRKKAKDLKRYIKNQKNANPEIFDYFIDWEDVSVPVNKITLIHNPIERLNKEPWCWYEITNLMKSAEETIFIQSPYIIPTKNMLKHLNSVNVPSEKICILTNSLAVSPNVLACSGYMNNRERIVDFGTTLYEFQGPGSIHAKSFIFDDRISIVGSFNFDSRSTYLSTETMVVIDSEEFAKELKGKMQRQVNSSLKVGKDYSYIPSPFTEEKSSSFLKVGLIRILSIITYFFDYLL